jgi:murein DD-endopeptidase MepM/ murein hydrolase activator NlpD
MLMPSIIERLKKYRALLILLLLLPIIINLQYTYIRDYQYIMNRINISITLDEVRKLKIDATADQIIQASERLSVPSGDLLTVIMVLNDYEVSVEKLNSISSSEFLRVRNRIVRFYPDQFHVLSDILCNLVTEFVYFPVPMSSRKFPWVNYENSWGNERTYGGERAHEGTDLMAGTNKTGIYPIISVCNGTVTNMGWLELGGYRIGITSLDGHVYYYYAHMQSYANNLKEGDAVVAGQFIGFMGNTGYSKVEGTAGKFDVHLHFGIYITLGDGTEIALNPYYILKSHENKVLYYNYGM